jgi:hypothetical protein
MHRYKFNYDLYKDASVEVATSIIYASDSFAPRSLRFNMTVNMFGKSINFIDAHLRMEGMTDIIKFSFIEQITSQEIFEKFMEKPENILNILQNLIDQVNYNLLIITFIKYNKFLFFMKS